ncbi:MAG: serine/threonine protein kinase [Planctomycetes bacterium]|nr:serine/threonine protein kinase [Planctomycetota bacterium]
MAGESQRGTRREETPPAIPGYEILNFIGRGSSGVVYRARQQAVDREVAIKILHAHLARESRVVRRLQREARTTARLAHPHIVSAVDMGETDGRWWYAMELVDGNSLAQRLKAEGRIREREALRLFIPLCEALEHLWEHGVTHRDIKPANILIDKAGGARLADLGLAVAEDDPSITGTGGTLGTPHYISPEQAVDPRKADSRSDIWSLGATLYHAVCGRPPFAGESAAEVLSGVLYAPIPDPQELEPALSSRLALVLRKCLTRDPANRYQNPRDLLLDLERVRERRAPRVQRRALDPLHKSADRSRRVAWGVAAGLLVVLSAGAAMLPRWLGSAPASAERAAFESGPFEPLAEIESRRANGLGKPAEWLVELQEIRARVPLHELAHYESLVSAVEGELRKLVRALNTEIEGEVEREVQAGDIEAGWRTLNEELEARFLRATGCGLAGLASVGVKLEVLQERLTIYLEAATEEALSELEALLLDWRSTSLAAHETAIGQQDWQQAFAALSLPDAPSVFAQAGFKLRLPAARQDGLLVALAAEFRQRSERLQDQWQELDRELKDFVVTRQATLERQLLESPPLRRIAAEEMLRGNFERELFKRHLTRDKMPAGLSRLALEELETMAHRLAEREAELLDDDARADFAEAEELAADAQRRRDYATALNLWEETRARVRGAPRFEGSSDRAVLVHRAEVRVAEARALDGLLERVSERVHALDGQTIELRWGSIVYPEVRVEAGPDPRREGFHVDRIAGALTLAGLPAAQFETFAGFGPEAELAPDARLTLAAFRLHDGRASDAQRALLSGARPATGLLRELADDLAARVAEALEHGDERAGTRELEAKRLLAELLDPRARKESPRVALARAARLLDEFGDLPAVRQQRAELLKLRSGLEESAPRDAEREFQRAFSPDPDKLKLLPLARVTLGYDFSEDRLGAWESGDWAFDGLGFTLAPRAAVLGWDQLAAEKGLELALRAPLVPDRFELRLRFEALQGETPARLLWISAAGFQIALSAADLPGASGAPGFLLGTEDGNAFVQRLLSSGGKGRDAPLLVPGTPPRELRLRAQRRSGRCELWLDGTQLDSSTGLRAPPSDPRAIVVRSWGSVRVLAVTIEGGR